MKPVAFILAQGLIKPARGGPPAPVALESLGEHPVLAWVICSAIESKVFEKVVVGTPSGNSSTPDDLEIQKIARFYKAETFGYCSESSDDDALVEFCCARPDVKVVCLIQVTSPLTKHWHFREAWELFNTDDFSSLVSVTELRRVRWEVEEDRSGVPVIFDPKSRYVENGCFCFVRTEKLLRTGRRVSKNNTCVFLLPSYCFVELREPEDLMYCQALAGTDEHGELMDNIKIYQEAGRKEESETTEEPPFEPRKPEDRPIFGYDPTHWALRRDIEMERMYLARGIPYSIELPASDEEVFDPGPIDPEELKEFKKMLEEQEKQRIRSE